MTIFNELTRRAAKSSVAAAALTCCMITPPVSHAQITTVAPDSAAWEQYGPLHEIDTDRMGYSDSFLDCSLCETTSNQELQTQYKIQIYKNRVPTNDGYDWYLVSAALNHSVDGYSGTSNWLSQGIYAEKLTLQIKSNATRGDYGPTSSVNSTSNTFSVGAQIGSGSSANFGWSQSVNTQDVSFATTADNHQMSIEADIATPNINDSSNAAIGYQFPSAITFRIPRGQTFQINARDGAAWDYVKPRPQVFERYQAWNSANIIGNFTGKQLVQNTSKQCFAVQNGILGNGHKVVLAPCSKQEATQKWSYTANGQIQVLNTNYCMDGAYSSTSAGAELVVGTCVTGKQSQILQLGQVWNFDQEALTCDSYFAACGYASGVYSATSWVLEMMQGNNSGTVPPDEAPTSSVLTNFAGNTVTSGTGTAAGTALYFQVPGGSAKIPSIMRKQIANGYEANNGRPFFTPTSTALALANNQFFTIQ